MESERQAISSLCPGCKHHFTRVAGTTIPLGGVLHPYKEQIICDTTLLIYLGSFTLLSGPNGEEQHMQLFKSVVLSLAAVILQSFFPVTDFQHIN